MATLVKKRRRSPEVCALAGCFLIIFLTITQILVFSHRSRNSEQPRTFPGRGLMGEQLTSRGNFFKEVPLLKSNPMTGAAIQARVRARIKVNQEVRELEKSLAKLIRENSITPEEAISEIANEVYARRINAIIRTAEKGGIVPFNVNGTRLRSSLLQFKNINDTDSNLNLQGTGNDYIIQNQKVPYTGENSSGWSLKFHQKVNLTDIRKHQKRKISPLKYSKDFDKSEEYDLSNLAPEAGEYLERNLSIDSEDGLGLDAEIKNELFLRDDFQAEQNEIAQTKCSEIPDTLVGNLTDINLNITLSVSDIMTNNSDVKAGGEWAPASCTSRHRVAIIIPYRDRWSHLKVLLYYLIPILKRQEIHFRIFIVEQYGNETFNKGRIMNAAFREALKLFDFHCVTFHDVDLVPEDDRNMYSCTEQPKHMSIGIDKFDYVLPYEGLVGGVLMFKAEQFELVNGYSNMYWGWGAEDDDMTSRILHHGLRVYRPPSNIARYKMVKHDGRQSSEVAIRMKLLRSAAKRSKLEGLNNVQYKLLETHIERLFTHFIVDIGHP